MIYKVYYDHNGEEQSWTVGEKFVGDYVQGEVTQISSTDLPFEGVNIWVRNRVALTILVSSVKRIYWMPTK